MPTAVEMLERELADLRKHEERLVGALAILKGSSTAERNGSQKTTRRTRTRSTTRKARTPRPNAKLNDDQIVNAIHAHGEPASAKDIRAALGLGNDASNRLSVKLKAMVDRGLLKRQGERAGSRYTPVS